MLHLNGQNLRLVAKNGRNSKTPGLHLSAAHGKEAAGRLTACPATQEATAQLDLLLRPLQPEPEREVENQPARRPAKLAPLELPKEVREAQRQKLKVIQHEAKATPCKQDGAVSELRVSKLKPCPRQRPVKATEPLKVQQSSNRPPRPQLTRTGPLEQAADRHLEEVVCRGTPVPLRSRPTPPLLSPSVRARAARGAEATRPGPAVPQQEPGKLRRPRLRRAQCLEEDQCNSNTSTGGLSADKAKLAQGV